MEAEVTGAQEVMRDETWNLAINYIDKKKKASTSEAVCNGIWNEILRRNFPYPKFIIAPEQRQTTGIRPDFTIFFVDKDKSEWHPVFTFEGKAPYHGDNKRIIKEGKEQAAGYVPSLSWSKHEEISNDNKITCGMFACGKRFMILQYDVKTGAITEFYTSSIDIIEEAKKFDDFCKKHADSFK
ncbi:uncharacterized protein FFB20_07100 [Fusarium fujikuroi]|uniref:Uncharacterized protein n=1 Tax=Fusarium fujikuroi TaxID=5127 RepID=A0A2H3S8A3_FUSFU|nr:Uncharacterized protein LW94_2573 [Fusarium fujikuroi]KLP02431.1 Uncharacterized protein Y057_1211 [Fusarium fujikuroi]QGJ01436.1 hypothetical protein CEK26_002880 [Fusarium fujikuroi]SCN83979.1 uncharacterized protein FFB20_07100 [Fusarium fujikuroi]SCO16627.1 uncharacterized protein FFC1_12920 [Fusarium fujikuroi]